MKLSNNVYRCPHCGEIKEVDVMADHSLFTPSHFHNKKRYVFELIASVEKPISTETRSVIKMKRYDPERLGKRRNEK